MAKNVMLSWPDRFALIEHFKPTDEQICNAFNVDKSELITARNLLENGTFSSKSNIDVNKFVGLFTPTAVVSTTTKTGSTVKNSRITDPLTKKGTATVHTKTTNDNKPQTATKKVKIPQKRGRKGDKIAKALQAVPTSPVPVDAFMKTQGVSLAVLRQSKRFLSKMDKNLASTIGTIFVRKDKASKQLMIWREDVRN